MQNQEVCQVKANLLTKYKIQDYSESSEEVAFKINLKTILLYIGTTTDSWERYC